MVLEVQGMAKASQTFVQLYGACTFPGLSRKGIAWNV